MLKINDIYNGWKILDIQSLTDYKSTGLWLRHIDTNMEIFHLLNDDEENLFAFGFKTLPHNSTGIPHIIEHSVLAGSKNYPLKDPFMQLCNQSVNTFLNAMTYPDKTVYPASSIAEADYFNLMAVYGDAVFFPLLDKKVFEQEGYHIEVDDDDTLSIQGVVYNEMKGAFSEFNRVVYTEVGNTLWPKTVYAVESGGDPSDIPHLTYEDFKKFHKKYYAPSNCRLFLSGNVSTEKQIDFINEKFLDNFDFHSQKTIVDASCYNLEPITTTQYSVVKGPAGDNEKDASVVMSWHLGDTSDTLNVMHSLILSELLMGNDSSPLAKVLLESGLGNDIFPWRDCDLDQRWISMGVGMRGVKPENAKKLEKLILATLSKLVKNGIDEAFVDSTIMAVDFEHREVTRSYGPYALKLMDKVYRGWMNGNNPFDSLYTRETFAKIKSNIKNDSHYIQNLIKTMLVDNNHRSCITVIPDKQYTENMNIQEQKNIASLTANMSDVEKSAYVDAVRKNQKKLQEYQISPEKEENRLLIPHLYPSQLKSTVNRIVTEQTTVGDVPLFVNNQATNGIVYVTAAIPVDVLDSEDYLYLPLYAALLTNTGCNGKSWAQTEADVARIVGGLSAKPFVASISPTKSAASLLNGKNGCLMGRQWLFVNVKMLEEKSEPAIKALFDCLDTADFSDTTRLKDILVKLRNGIDNAVLPGGSQFASYRSCCTKTKSKAIDEIWNGLTQLMFLHSFSDDKLEKLSERLQKIQKKLQKTGLTVNLTSDDSGIKTARPILEKAVSNKIAPVLPAKVPDDDFFNLTKIVSADSSLTENSKNLDDKRKSQNHEDVKPVPYIRYIVPSQIGFAASTTDASSYGTAEAASETLLAHWMSNTILYEQIRTVGGAYGAGASADSMDKLFKFYTYRDPNPDKSINVFVESLKKVLSIQLDKVEVERLITGCYSKLVQPRSPSGNGFISFIRILCGITDEDREKNLNLILSATAKDINDAARRISANSEAIKSAIISGKKSSYTGKIVNLPV